MWCFDRFGYSKTRLADGRTIYIGGEHEDFYDPDFCIFNDVTVIDQAGSISIFGYPEADFPPIDFHSSTLVGDAIFILGCLGHQATRNVGHTPVYKLSLDTYRIDAISTTGECPGWLSRHKARLGKDGSTIIVRGGEIWLGSDQPMTPNIDLWSFDTRAASWTRLTSHDWQMWSIKRVDGRNIDGLKDARNLVFKQGLSKDDRSSVAASSDEKMRNLDADALERLYRVVGIDDPLSPMDSRSPYQSSFTQIVDGLTVRIKEGLFDVSFIVEGRLTAARLGQYQATTLSLLERIAKVPFKIVGSDAP
jgi:hypothetical protein